MNGYFTCQELVDNHTTVKLFDWNASRIGVFSNCCLLDYQNFGKHSRVMISEESFLKLIGYVYALVDLPDPNPIYLSYDEVLDSFPQARKFHWNPNVIGIFLHSKLLVGKKSSKESSSLITKQSATRLIKYTNQRWIDICNMPFI